MKLYYDPLLARVLTDVTIPLYTQEAVNGLTEHERNSLRELDEEGIKLIGDKACQIVSQVESIEEQKQKEEWARRRSEEFSI